MQNIRSLKWALLAGLVGVVGTLGIQAVMAKDEHASNPKGRADFMQRFDTNKDGAVTFDEMVKIRDNRWKEKNPSKAADASTVEKANAKMREHFDKLDVNKDGKITKDEVPSARVVSREEFLKHSGESFDKIDANKDGKLTAEEREQFREKMRAQAAQHKAKGKKS
jgi:Ca2+-binding EF-hand superfamily protein